MATPQEVRELLEVHCQVTDGASESCQFVEVFSLDWSDYVTVDLRSLSRMSEENRTAMIQILLSHLGVV